MKRIDLDNLYVKLVRGRTRTLFFQFGTWVGTEFGLLAPNPLTGYPLTPIIPRVDRVPPVWQPTDITYYRFSFSINNTFSQGLPPYPYPLGSNNAPPLKYDPVTNIADPTQGILAWNVYGNDLLNLFPGNYYFEMSVISDGVTVRHFCSGVIALIDTLNASVSLPPQQHFPLTTVDTSVVNFNLEG
jgi:hypothetical protein